MTFTFDKWTLVSSRNHKNNEKIKYNYIGDEGLYIAIV